MWNSTSMIFLYLMPSTLREKQILVIRNEKLCSWNIYHRLLHTIEIILVLYRWCFIEMQTQDFVGNDGIKIWQILWILETLLFIEFLNIF